MIKRLFCILLLVITAAKASAYEARTVADVPNVNLSDARRFTSDPDGILSAAAIDSIDRMLYRLKAENTAEAAVVVVGSIGDADVFGFGHDLFQKWGIGSSERNNGLLILLVIDQREIRFVTGYGVESVLPDALCRRIQAQYMVPPFGRGDWDGGMIAGVAAVRDVLAGSELNLGADGGDDLPDNVAIAIVMLFTGGFIALAMLLARLSSPKCSACGKRKLQRTGSHIVGRTAMYDTVEEEYVCRNCGARSTRVVRYNRFGDPRNNGGRGIGGGLGGFGGFGGGSFGGGGFGGGMSGGGGAGSRF